MRNRRPPTNVSAASAVNLGASPATDTIRWRFLQFDSNTSSATESRKRRSGRLTQSDATAATGEDAQVGLNGLR